MNYHSISDSLWTDYGFRSLTPNGKLLLLCFLSSNLLEHSGVFFATVGMITEYTGSTKPETTKAIDELVESGFILYFHDYVILKNYLKFNSAGQDTHRIRIVKDLNGLSCDVFNVAMSIPAINAIYYDYCEKIKCAPRECSESYPIDTLSIPYRHPMQKPQPKPKPKPEPVTESEEIQRLRGYVAAIIADFPDSKNSKNELTADQYQKLIDKYGYSKLVVMQRIYFEWKVSRKEKTKTTDFGTLNKGDGWVVTEADKHEPEPEQPIEEPWVRPEWKYTYPKPDNYETMDQRQINVYLVACAKEQNALETAKYIETCMAKSEQEAKEAAEQAELMRWKYPFPKPEFWDGMSEPARASYIRRNTLPEDVAK